MNKKLLFLMFFGVIWMGIAAGQEASLNVDFSVVVKQNVRGASGANLSWLLDSDKYRPRPRSMQVALSEMGTGALRYPYGHLADNYLWTTPPYEKAVDGLTPRVATMSMTPGQWKWAVNADGTFVNAMDFDEYIALCKAIGAEPLVVVNVLSFRYKNGPSLETLIDAAAEWVKYANVIRKYGVKYWQLGNEVEHTREITKDEYVEIFGKMASAMKQADPSIKVGTGVLGQTDWNRRVLQEHPGLVSFISAHQYTFNQAFAERGYEGWKNQPEALIPNIRKMRKLLNEKPEYADIELMITETGAIGGEWPDKRTNDLYKSLYWFEMNMEELLSPNVKYTFFWSTHSPWNGDNRDTALENLLTNKDNKSTPTGSIVEIINACLPRQMVKTNCNNPFLRLYAGISVNKEKAAVFVLNKNDKPEPAVLDLSGFDSGNYKRKKLVFRGDSPGDENPEIKRFQNEEYVSGRFTEIFAPYSLTVLLYEKK